jgi:hypothetical protein
MFIDSNSIKYGRIWKKREEMKNAILTLQI